MELPFDLAVPLMGVYPKEPQTLILKECKHLYIHRSIYYNCQDIEAAQVFCNRAVNKTNMGHYLAVNKEENFTLGNSIDRPGEHYTT